jgi:hypothetical protein
MFSLAPDAPRRGGLIHFRIGLDRLSLIRRRLAWLGIVRLGIVRLGLVAGRIVRP